MTGSKRNDKVTIEYGHRFYRRYGKRALDILFSGLALLLLSPLLLILTIMVRIKHGSPVLFTPTRPGMNERIFKICKFRSMSNATDNEGKLLPEKDRLTRFGKILRASSLDELPELINIFRGDMSIVGPRPLAKGYLVSYTQDQRIRHSVRPGLTGLAQISGRNNLPWDQRIEKDYEYVRDMSFLLDCSIVIRTFLKVVKSEDITIPGGKTYDLAASNLIKEEGTPRHMNADTTWPEIGSHFWTEPKGAFNNDITAWCSSDEDGSLTFSGRAAIALALSDAAKTRKLRRAYVPSYCCLSMLQPFIDADVKYDFYDVAFNGERLEYKINDLKKYDVLLIMKYFGAEAEDYVDIIRAAKQSGCTVIEDITHTLLSTQPADSAADYHVASLRKWFPTASGGFISKVRGTLACKPDIDSDHAVIKKLAAMDEKRDYIEGRGGKKEDFLAKYSAFDLDLIQLDPLLKIDSASAEVLRHMDTEGMKRRRQDNAAVLYRRLKDVKGLTFLNCRRDAENDVPLFVPIMLPEDKRDALRRYLIDNGVYCPVHWPEVLGAEPGIRKNELSLICDHRYNEKDMNAVADLICDWCRDNM